MSRLVAWLARKGAGKLFLILLVAAGLAAWQLASASLAEAEQAYELLQDEARLWDDALPALTDDWRRTAGQATARIDALAPGPALAARRAQLDAERAACGELPGSYDWAWAARGREALLALAARHHACLTLAAEARAIDLVAASGTSVRRLMSGQESRDLKARIAFNRAEGQKLARRYPGYVLAEGDGWNLKPQACDGSPDERLFGPCPAFLEYRRRIAAYEQRLPAVAAAEQAIGAARALPDPLAAFASVRAAQERELTCLGERTRVGVWGSVRPWLSKAAGIIFLAFVVAVGWKALWYFLVAPTIARRPAAALRAAGGAVEWDRARIVEGGTTGASEVVTVRLAPHEAMRIDPAILLAGPGEAGLRTGTDFGWAGASVGSALAVGLMDGTTLAPTGPEPVEVALSAEDAAARERLGIIAVPAGAAFVIDAMAMRGFIAPADRPPRIERPVTLGTQALAAGTIRPVIVHGPVSLIVAGVGMLTLRTVAEPTRVAGGAVVGWSAGLRAGLVRTAAFWPYLLGVRALMDRSFAPAGDEAGAVLIGGGATPARQRRKRGGSMGEETLDAVIKGVKG